MNRQRSVSILVVVWLVGSAMLAVFWAAFAGNDLRRITLTTLELGLCSAAVAVPVGFLVAWAQARIGGRIASLCLILILAMIFVPLHLQVAMWDAALGKLGWLRSDVGLRPVLSGFWAAVWVQGMAGVPWSVLMGAVAIRRGGFQLEQQALMDAAGWRVFWSVTFRRMLPFFALAMIWIVVLSSREIAATDIYQVGTFAEEIYLQFSGGRFDWFGIDPTTGESERSIGLLANVLSTIWLVLTTAICILALVPRRRFDLTQVSPLPMKASQKIFCRAILLLSAAVVVVVPICNLVLRTGFQVTQTERGPFSHFSFEHFLQTLGQVPLDYRVEWMWSLGIGIMTALIAGLLATYGASTCRDGSGFRFWIFLIFVCFSLALPGPVVGILVAKFFSTINWGPINWLYDRTIAGPVIATSMMAFGPAALLMLFLFRTISKETIDAAELEGVSRNRVFSGLTFAQIAPGFLVCVAVCFLIGYGDLSASYIPMPPGIDTLPRRILGQMHAGVNDMTAALSLVNLLIAGTISILAINIVMFLQHRAGLSKSGE